MILCLLSAFVFAELDPPCCQCVITAFCFFLTCMSALNKKLTFAIIEEVQLLWTSMCSCSVKVLVMLHCCLHAISALPVCCYCARWTAWQQLQQQHPMKLLYSTWARVSQLQLATTSWRVLQCSQLQLTHMICHTFEGSLTALYQSSS